MLIVLQIPEFISFSRNFAVTFAGLAAFARLTETALFFCKEAVC